jgi:hypothetical protein
VAEMMVIEAPEIRMSAQKHFQDVEVKQVGILDREHSPETNKRFLLLHVLWGWCVCVCVLKERSNQ